MDVEGPSNGMGVGITRLVLFMEHVFTGGWPPAIEDFGDTSFSIYWNQAPEKAVRHH
jgi:hypothetical protein